MKVGLLGGEHHPPPAQTLGRDGLLDGDCPSHVHSEARDHGGRQRSRREGEVQGVQPSDEGGRGHLPGLGHATGTVHQSENLLYTRTAGVRRNRLYSKDLGREWAKVMVINFFG